MNKIITYIKYNKKTIINLLFLILIIIGVFVAFKYLK